MQQCYIVGTDRVLVDIETKFDDEFLDEFAGITIGNTMTNSSVLFDEQLVLLGFMSDNIQIGD
ncbi:MAG: hypothetical protein ACI93V_000275 [Alteromonadaceae bacterium]|jgi:hypothetical protein|tara:strand:+ start:179 stop:367 length:189 start_codon:yes stop_codon:yes gene_type:complete